MIYQIKIEIQIKVKKIQIQFYNKGWRKNGINKSKWDNFSRE